MRLGLSSREGIFSAFTQADACMTVTRMYGREKWRSGAYVDNLATQMKWRRFHLMTLVLTSIFRESVCVCMCVCVCLYLHVRRQNRVRRTRSFW